MFRRRPPEGPPPAGLSPAPEPPGAQPEIPPPPPSGRPDATAEPAPATEQSPPRLRAPATACKPKLSRVDGVGQVLVIGRDIRLSGEIRHCARLLVDGTLEGDVRETDALEITESGRVAGTAVVETCRIAGGFEGDLTVSGLLVVRARGRVRGQLSYGELEIERGGRIVGRVDRQSPDAVVPADPAPEAAEGPV